MLDQALQALTHSLTMNQVSENLLRLKTLKKIEKILGTQRRLELEKQEKIIALALQEAQTQNNPDLKGIKSISRRYKHLQPQGKEQLSQNQQKVQRYLSKHFVNKQSIVFIVDKQFSSVFFYERALDLVQRVFGRLQNSDYFGFLALDSHSMQQKIVIEEKGFNTQAKVNVITDHIQTQVDFYSRDQAEDFFENQSREQWLSQSLTTALEWQMQVQDVTADKYTSPHKHIVCLLGSGELSIGSFHSMQAGKLTKCPNLNISILGLSSNPFVEHVMDYKQLCALTPEGVFCNITDRQTCDALIKQFAMRFDVYQSRKLPLITELFQIL